MKSAQIYCTALEMIQDMKLDGFDASVIEHIEAASRTVEHDVGKFIPSLETRSFKGHCGHLSPIGPVISISKILNDDVEVTLFSLLPDVPLWEDGPYLKVDADVYWGESVEITGLWAKYSRVKALGISASLALAATELTVTDGSLLCPGMVLLIDAEQVLVLEGIGSVKSPAPIAAVSTISVANIASEEIINVTNGAEFHAGETLQIGVEDLFIRKISGNQLYVSRGWNNTPASDQLAGAAISVYRTFLVDRGMNGTIDAEHTDAALQRYMPPEDVNYLCRQIAGLMHKKASSGFIGRIGDATSGEGGYFSEFPPNQIDRVRLHYKIWSF